MRAVGIRLKYLLVPFKSQNIKFKTEIQALNWACAAGMIITLRQILARFVQEQTDEK